MNCEEGSGICGEIFSIRIVENLFFGEEKEEGRELDEFELGNEFRVLIINAAELAFL